MQKDVQSLIETRKGLLVESSDYFEYSRIVLGSLQKETKYQGIFCSF